MNLRLSCNCARLVIAHPSATAVSSQRRFCTTLPSRQSCDFRPDMWTDALISNAASPIGRNTVRQTQFKQIEETRVFSVLMRFMGLQGTEWSCRDLLKRSKDVWKAVALDILTDWDDILWQVYPDYAPRSADTLFDGAVGVDQAFIMQMPIPAFEEREWCHRVAANDNEAGAWRGAAFRFLGQEIAA